MNTCMQVWSSARGVQSGPTPDENDGGGPSAWVTRGCVRDVYALCVVCVCVCDIYVVYMCVLCVFERESDV